MARVPRFGDSENGDHAPYTVRSEIARAGEGGGEPLHPIDPRDNPTAFSDGGRGGGNNVHGSLQPLSKRSNEFNPSERKVEPQGGQHHPTLSPARSNNKSPTSRNPIPEKGRALPKFGEWNDSPPAGGYTHIFNEVKEGRQAANTRVPAPDNRNHYGRHGNRHDESPTPSCFGCLFRR